MIALLYFEVDLNYRADIDGLRAIAVLSVIMTHAFKDIFPNGFLGVDVFFVVSGFVITASLMSQKGLSLSEYLMKFYTRRFARLMPALLLVVAFTTLAISLVNPFPNDYLKTGLFAIFGLANVNLYLAEQDYFSHTSALNPFTHTWSLGVEEQFYLLIPVILWVRLRKNGAALALGVLSVVSVISLIAWIITSKVSPSAAFYLIPFRFWELAAGVLVALFLHNVRRRESIFPGILENRLIGAVCAVLLTVILFFPTEIALLPATAVAILCTAVILMRDISGTLPGYLLTSQFMNLVGRSSYSIYLWHWPIIVLGLWTIGGGLLVDTGLVIASMSIGYLSYRYVENPIRHGFPLKGASALGVWITCMVGVSVIPVSIEKLLPSLYIGQEVEMDAVGISSLTDTLISHDGSRWIGEECVLNSYADVGMLIDTSRCTLGRPSNTGTQVLVAGNSHSAAFVPAFEQISIETNTVFTVTSSWGASPIGTVSNSTAWRETNDYYWSTLVPNLIGDLKSGDAVFLISALNLLMPSDINQETQKKLEAFRLGLSEFSSRLSEREISLFVLSPLPLVREAKCNPSMAVPQWFAPNGAPCLYYTRTETERRQYPLRMILAELESAGLLTVVNLDSIFCPTDVCTFFADDETILYRDVFAHPSAEAARLSAGTIREQLLIP